MELALQLDSVISFSVKSSQWDNYGVHFLSSSMWCRCLLLSQQHVHKQHAGVQWHAELCLPLGWEPVQRWDVLERRLNVSAPWTATGRQSGFELLGWMSYWLLLLIVLQHFSSQVLWLFWRKNCVISFLYHFSNSFIFKGPENIFFLIGFSLWVIGSCMNTQFYGKVLTVWVISHRGFCISFFSVLFSLV